MAFCKYCGKELQGEEICTCQQIKQMETESSVEAEKDNIESAQQQTQQLQQAQQSQQPNKYLEKGKEVWKDFVAILRAPSISGDCYIKKEDRLSAIIAVLMQAILSGVFGSVLISKINSLLSLAGSFLEDYKFSGGTAFMYTLLLSILFAILFGGIFWVICKIAKVTLSINQTFSIVAVRSMLMIPVIALSVLLSLINFGIGIACFYLSVLFVICVLPVSVKEIQGMSDTKSVYIVFFTIIIFSCIALFIMSKAYVLYIPDSIKNVARDVSNLDSLLEMLF